MVAIACKKAAGGGRTAEDKGGQQETSRRPGCARSGAVRGDEDLGVEVRLGICLGQEPDEGVPGLEGDPAGPQEVVQP